MPVLLIPNGNQYFADNNGLPLALGTVGMYIPGSMTPKDTWQDPDQSALNINPILLDAAGRAIIWGAGDYRQIVKDSLGNVIWDREVSAGTGQDVYWGGTSGGAPNLQTLTVPGFTFQSGAQISWIAGFTNTSALFVSVNGGGSVQLFANSSAGGEPLSGGEIVAGNLVTMVADQIIGGFRIISGTATTQDLNVLGTFSLSGVLVPSALTTDTNDYDPPGIEDSSTIQLSSTIDVNLSGINAPLVDGTFYWIDNTGTKTITLLSKSTLSAPGNRFLISNPVPIPPDGSVEVHYDGVNAGWRVIPQALLSREKITADRTYYVRTDGNDSNNGLADTTAGAFLTWQKAVDTISQLDFNGFAILVRCTQTGVTFSNGFTISAPMVGQADEADLTFRGDTTTPGNVVIATSGGVNSITVDNGARCLIEGLRVTTSGAGGNAITASNFANLSLGAMSYGAVNTGCIISTLNALISLLGNYSINGAQGAHMQATLGGRINVPSAITATASGIITIGTCVLASKGGQAFLSSLTMTGGTVTGNRSSGASGAYVYAGDGTGVQTRFLGNANGTFTEGAVIF